jgi:DNA-binding Xre family transcriptional regulator
VAKIVNRFNNLLAQVEVETGNRPTYREIQQETGIAISTLSSYATNQVSRYDERTVIELCQFFDKRLDDGCTLADLLEYPPALGQKVMGGAVPA